MAKQTLNIKFGNATISLGDNEIVEYKKDSIVKHTLSDIVEKFKGKKIDITFAEASELEPTDVESN